MVKTSVMPNFSQFIVPSSLFTSNLSSMITIRMSMVITLLQFRLSLLFFVLFYRIMSVFTECIHPETKIAVFSYCNIRKIICLFKTRLIIINYTSCHTFTSFIYNSFTTKDAAPFSVSPVRLCSTIILPQIHNLFHIFGISQ